MANQLANQQNIELFSALNLDKNKSEILPFTGVNKRNSPLYNGNLHNFSRYDSQYKTVIRKNGDIYRLEQYNGLKIYDADNHIVGSTGLNYSKITQLDIHTPENAITSCVSHDAKLCYVTVNGEIYYDNTLLYTETYINNYEVVKCCVMNKYLIVWGFSKSKISTAYSNNPAFFYDVFYLPGTWRSVNNRHNINMGPFKLGKNPAYVQLCSLYPVVRSVNAYNSSNELLNNCFGIFWNFNAVQYLNETDTTPVLMAPGCYCEININANSYQSMSAYVSGTSNGFLNDASAFFDPTESTQTNFLIANAYDNFIWKLLVFDETTDYSTIRYPYGRLVSIAYKRISDGISYLDASFTAPSSWAGYAFRQLNREKIDFTNNKSNTYVGPYTSYGFIEATDSSSGTTEYGDITGTLTSKYFYYDRGYGYRINSAVQIGSTGYRILTEGGVANGPEGALNDDTVIGISYGYDDKMGTLITPWGTIDNDVIITVESNTLYYKGNDGNFYKISSAYSTPNDIKVIDDRYILVKTNSRDNLFDMDTKKWYNFCPDWNNRFVSCGSCGAYGNLFTTSRRTTTVSYASGINANYEVEKLPVNSMLENPKLLTGGTTKYDYYQSIGYTEAFKCAGGLPVDIYLGDSLQSCTYSISLYDGLIWKKKPALEELNFPISSGADAFFTPSQNSNIINTNSREILMKDVTTSYKLLQYDSGKNLFLYNYGSTLDDIECIFSIQGQMYCIKNNFIFIANYNDQNIVSTTSVIDVRNLQFIGNSIEAAYFYSPKNRHIYRFTGNRTFDDVMSLTEVETVNAWNYDTSTSILALATTDFVLMLFNDAYTIKIDLPGITAIDFTPEGILLYKNWNTYYFTYNEVDFGENLTKVDHKLYFETALYGYGDNRVSVVDCWYIKLYSEEAIPGTVEIVTTSMTNISTKSEKRTYTITAEMWDKNTKMCYIRHQPNLQRGAGVSVSIISDFDINTLSCSSSADSTIQLSKPVTTINTIGGKI